MKLNFFSISKEILEKDVKKLSDQNVYLELIRRNKSYYINFKHKMSYMP